MGEICGFASSRCLRRAVCVCSCVKRKHILISPLSCMHGFNGAIKRTYSISTQASVIVYVLKAPRLVKV